MKWTRTSREFRPTPPPAPSASTTTSSSRAPRPNQQPNNRLAQVPGEVRPAPGGKTLHISDKIDRPARYNTNTTVRRALSIVLLLLFSAPLILPLLALTVSSEMNLPACCRRNGAHHCMMKAPPTESDSAATNLSAIPQRCPAYPAVVTPVRHGNLSF